MMDPFSRFTATFENPAGQLAASREPPTSPPAQTKPVGDPGKTSSSCPVKEGEPGVAQSPENMWESDEEQFMLETVRNY